MTSQPIPSRRLKGWVPQSLAMGVLIRMRVCVPEFVVHGPFPSYTQYLDRHTDNLE